MGAGANAEAEATSARTMDPLNIIVKVQIWEIFALFGVCVLYDYYTEFGVIFDLWCVRGEKISGIFF